MNITRNNYEAFFILYMDNELDQEGRLAVEAFAQAHPDLGEELTLLLQTRFVPDSHIRFEGKEALLQTTTTSTINENNYLDWFILHTDQELNARQESELLDWLAQNPGYKDELNILLRTRMEPDNAVIFDHKESLYRQETPRRAIVFTWRRIAVAASLLIAISTTALLLNNSDEAGNDPVSGPVALNSSDSNKTKQSTIAENQSGKEENPGQQTNTDNPDTGLKDIAVVPAAKDPATKKIQQVDNRHTNLKSEPDFAVSNTDNKLPDGSRNPNLKGNGTDNNTVIADNSDWVKLEAPQNTPLTNSKQIKLLPHVTPDKLQPSDFVYAGNQIVSEEGADMDEPGKKNKLRGFFRKVTRTFEKATNLKATDEDDRLLIGGLSIQL